ncbi:MAG TPA: hypothetical protein VM490_19810 [Armatimonadaceae bacterium]|nr:hypothetical protein [Armatimonadaceae bacterium]
MIRTWAGRLLAAATVLATATMAGGAARAAPPSLDLKPTFGDALIPGRWQPVTVTATNPPDGDALVGAIRVTLEDPYTEQPLAAYRRDITLPQGAATAETTLLILVPDGTPPEIQVLAVRGRGASDDAVARRRFDKIPSRPGGLRVLAVAPTPDALSYLDGGRFGVYHDGGALLPAFSGNAAPAAAARRGPGGLPGGGGTNTAATPVQTLPLPEPGRLPDRAAAYDSIALVYLGDVPPDAFSDAQIEALGGYVRAGGVTVLGGARLRRDERFRRFAPPPSAGEKAAWRRAGRGWVVTLPFDAATPQFTARPDAARYWRGIFTRATAPPRLGAYLESGTSWYASSFADSAIFAPGLRAPSAAWFGGFMAAYLLLVAPVNYFVLKRLGRREWTWFTVPALVALFSLGAYRLGFATKGTDLYQNVTALVEMGPDGGEATAVAYVGLFSPRRAAYDIRAETPDALLFEPQGRRRYSGRGGNSGSPTGFGVATVDQDARPGSTARGADVAMWAMRVFGVRTDALAVGDGVRVRVRREGNRLVGTVENRTKRTLGNAVLFGVGGQQKIGTLAPGQTVSVRYAADPDAEQMRVESPLAEVARRRDPRRQSGSAPGGSPAAAASVEERLRAAMRERMAFSAGQILEEVRVSEATGRAGARPREAALPPTEVTLAAWNDDPLLPVRVDGKAVANGAHVNLILVRAPVANGE